MNSDISAGSNVLKSKIKCLPAYGSEDRGIFSGKGASADCNNGSCGIDRGRIKGRSKSALALGCISR